LLPKILKVKDRKRHSPGQMLLPWGETVAKNPRIQAVAEKFVAANAYDPKMAMRFFNDS
jgi:putative transposase